MTATPAPGDLKARHVEVLRELLSKEAPHRGQGYPLVEARIAALDYAIAALSALPAGGGEITVDREVLENADAALAISNYEGDHWGEYESPRWELRSALGLPCEKATTPPPDADKAMRQVHFNGLRGLMPDGSAPPDAAVGAQGEEGVRAATPEEETAIDAAAGLAQVTFRLPTEMLGELDHRAQQEGLVRNAKLRFILADYLSAAPAAGKGVDTPRAAFHAWVKSRGGDVVQREGEYLSSMTRLWWECWQAALTRQPVAGDGWRPIESAPRDGTRVRIKFKSGRDYEANWQTTYGGEWHVDSYKYLPWADQHEITHWQPLPAAPADTPADGGEDRS